MFSPENTTDFTTAEIVILNDALAQLQQVQPDVDEKTHSDRLTNTWQDGSTVEMLVRAARVTTSNTRLHGRAAIDYAEARGLPLCKYADPTEGTRADLTTSEAEDVAREDEGLIWIDTADGE